jgi:DNA-binding response OmpR family regulator
MSMGFGKWVLEKVQTALRRQLLALEGKTLCRKLREFDQTTPILFYSGAAHESDIAGAMAAGAQGYVVEPSDPDELTSQIHALIK